MEVALLLLAEEVDDALPEKLRPGHRGCVGRDLLHTNDAEGSVRVGYDVELRVHADDGNGHYSHDLLVPRQLCPIPASGDESRF